SFQPSNRYYETNLSAPGNTTNLENKESKESSDRLRFGIPITTYGNTGNGVQYGSNTGTGYVFSPMKIDVGGIALGALIGLGAILIVPKIAAAFTGGYGYRSLEDDMSSVTEMLARIDNSLEQHNIDSSSCMQRIICTYVNEAQRHMQTGEANTIDQFIFSLTNNSLFSYMLDGTTIKQAVDMGKEGDAERCSSLYAKCPVSKENITKVIAIPQHWCCRYCRLFKMGLCKCPKRRVTNQFCFEHRVCVCENCMVTNHPICVVQSYLQWLQDSDYNSICELCNKVLNVEDSIRLTCYHHFSRQLPPTTAPRGYSCPSCKSALFPPSNLISPVADVLKEKLAGVNWARAGLGLPLLSEEREVKAVVNHVTTSSIPTSSKSPNPTHSVVNVEDQGAFNRTGADGYQASSNRRIFQDIREVKPVVFDHDDDKYKRRPASELVRTWWRSKEKSDPKKKSGGFFSCFKRQNEANSRRPQRTPARTFTAAQQTKSDDDTDASVILKGPGGSDVHNIGEINKEQKQNFYFRPSSKEIGCIQK
ncbi:zinc finger protein-like 1, partial [Asbolus verrucosus]